MFRHGVDWYAYGKFLEKQMTNKDHKNHIERTKRMIDWEVLGLIAIQNFPKTLEELANTERKPCNQAGG